MGETKGRSCFNTKKRKYVRKILKSIKRCDNIKPNTCSSLVSSNSRGLKTRQVQMHLRCRKIGCIARIGSKTIKNYGIPKYCTITKD